MNKEVIHRAVMVVDSRKTAILLTSEPDLYEFDTFDGNDMHDNISENNKDIPATLGLYSCKVVVNFCKYWTDCGYEHDVTTRITDIKLLYVPTL